MMKSKNKYLELKRPLHLKIIKLSLMCLFGLIVGCDEEITNLESENITEEIVKRNLTSSYVKAEEIPEIIEHISGITGKNFFDSTSKGKDGAIFSKSNIRKIKDTLNNINYSFPFVYEDSPENVYFNFIVPLNTKGKPLEPFVLRYELNPENLDSFESNGRKFEDFNGDVGLFFYKDFFQTKKPYGKYVCETRFDQYGDPIPCDIVSLPDGGSGGPASTGGGESTSPSSPGGGNEPSGSGECTWYMEATCYCNGDLVGSHDHSEPALVIDCGGSGASKSSKGDCDDCYSTGSSGVALYPKSVMKLDYYFNAIGYNLNADQLNYLNKYSLVAKNINQFLISKGRTTANLEFAKDALEVIMSGDGRVNILAGIINTVSVKCAADAIQEASTKDAGLIDTIYDIFGTDNDASYNITYSDEPFAFDPTGEIGAGTEPFLDTSGNLTHVEITFNFNYLLNATDLSVYTSVLHENLHAIMFYQLNEADIDIDHDNIDFSIMAEQWSEYVAEEMAGNSPGMANINWIQHQVVSDLVDNMALLIKEFGESKGYDVDLETATALAWGGLEETTAWQVLNTVDKIVFQDIINKERNGRANNTVGELCY